MRELFNFIQKNVHWLLFLLLVFLSVLLIVKNNQYQRSKYLSVAHEITGRIHAVSSGIQSYMNLNTENADLLKKISDLENEVYFYKRTIELLNNTTQTESIEIDSSSALVYNFIPARVVYNNISGTENYIQLNKGSEDGIKPDMGVMAPNGIVGVIMNVSPHYSIAISVLNPKFQLNCKLKDKNYFGPLVWDGKDFQYTYLENLPSHAEFEIGDTIVTSGYSAFFPEGLPVGTIVDSRKQKNDNYNSALVQLFADFSTLTEVMIIENSYKEEQNNLLRNIRK
ncbi:MAG: rod shape-determining protein MreC [Bacteroidales bacterium]|nr:rod shape-determining protein MreC [Bacteroidales bacterium]